MSRIRVFLLLMATFTLVLSGTGIYACADSLILPDSLIAIEDEAFYADPSISKVIIPEGTTDIGHLTFANSSVTEITLPNSLESIASDAFSGCSKLETVKASRELIARLEIDELFSDTPWLIASGEYDKNIAWHFVNDGTLYITGNGVLYGYSQPWYEYLNRITCVYIGNGITMIDGPAFSGCSVMTECHLPEGLQEIRNDTFRECMGLTSITLPSSMETIGSSAFYGCGNLKSITINNGLKHIENDAFAHNYALQTLVLPQSLQSIDPTAFYADSSLKHFDVMPGNAYFTALDGVLYSADMKTLVLCPRVYSGTFVIPNGVTEIGPCAFQGCSMTDVDFPDSLVTIREKAFAECRNLESVTLGSSVAVIKQQAFQTCTGLRSISLPSTVSVIESYVFTDCYALSAINVEEGNAHFSSANGVLLADNCTVLVFCPMQYSGSFVCPDGIVEIADGAFMACTAMTDITLPDGLKTIGKGAFNQCSATSVNLPDSVEQIGENAFLNSKIASITIPKGVLEMGAFAFGSCWDLKHVIIEDGLESISYGAFANCSAIESIDIPSSVNSIGLYAFNQCSNLKAINVSSDNSEYSSIDGVLCNKSGTTIIQYPSGCSAAEYHIPDGVTRINSFAFGYCDALESISMQETIAAIGIEAIHGCLNLQRIEFEGTSDQWDMIYWDTSGNWIAGYDPQEFIALMNSLVIFN